MNIPAEYLAALREAQNRLNRRDAKGAIHIGEQLLRAMPKHPGVHLLLGRAHALQGDVEPSLARFRAATELVPGDPGVWTEFITALLKAGQKGRARKAAQKAPVNAAERKKLLDLAKGEVAPSAGPSAGGAPLEDIRRIQTLLQAAKPEEARDGAARLLKAHPRSAALLNLAGVAALALDDFDAAEKHFLETCRISPLFVGGKVNLGLARVGQRNFKDAIRSFLDALSLEPASVDARKNLVLAAADSHDQGLAIEQGLIFLDVSGEDPDVLKALATALTAMRRFDEAFDVIDRLETATGADGETRRMRLAALLDADRVEEARAFADRFLDGSPELRMESARLRAQMGDLDGARSDLRQLIEEKPEEISAYARYGIYAKWTEDDPLLPMLETAAEKVAPGSRDEAPAFYALAKAHLDLGRDDLGFAALHRANAAQRFVYDFPLEERRRVEIKKRWSRETIEHLASLGDKDFAPVFIIGTPRSGSTLLEHVIAAHPAVVSVGEDSLIAPFFPLGMPATEAAVREAAMKSREACRPVIRPGAVLLDKLLHNFMRLGALASAFPSARFVHTSRDPRAVALSIYRNEFRQSHAYSADLGDIARFFTDYLGYMAHWKRAVGERVVEVRYEALVADPEPRIRDLIGRLGLEWDDACLRPEAVQKRVKTLSIAQVRSGINTDSSELWQRFETHLAPFTKLVSKVWDFDAGQPRLP